MLEIGATLRAAREQQGITIEDAAEATKIRTSYLEALERESFEQLPGATYARGFLRAYGDYLGLDPQELIDEFSERFASAPWETDDEVMFPRRRGPRAQERASRSSNIVLVVLAGIVAVAVLVVIASTYPSTRETPLPDAGTTVVTVTEPVVNPVATAVTAETAPMTETTAAPVLLRIRPKAQVTVTVRPLEDPDVGPPLFQAEIAPREDQPDGINIPRSPTGYLIRLDRPGTVTLEVNGKIVSPGANDTLLSVDPNGRVAEVDEG